MSSPGGLTRPRRLSDSVWRLGSHHVASFLVRGRGASALFETGITATAPLILAQLDALGVARAEVRHLVLSHAHADHATGQAGLMAGLPRATLLLTAASADFLARPKTLAMYESEERHTAAEVARRDGLAGPFPAAGPLLPAPWRVLAEGTGGEIAEELDLGGVTLRFIPDGGHAPGGLIAHVPQEEVILASDSAGFVTPAGPTFPLWFVSFSAYQATLARLAALAPQVVGVGHQMCFLGPAAPGHLERVMAHHQAEHELLLAGRAAGRAPEDLAQGLFARHYHGELTVYSAESILNCCRLLVRRSVECLDSQSVLGGVPPRP
jgi:glyoxylase-like metal-dependent hydrolase (beta-lactamase superfamily II)